MCLTCQARNVKCSPQLIGAQCQKCSGSDTYMCSWMLDYCAHLFQEEAGLSREHFDDFVRETMKIEPKLGIPLDGTTKEDSTQAIPKLKLPRIRLEGPIESNAIAKDLGIVNLRGSTEKLGKRKRSLRRSIKRIETDEEEDAPEGTSQLSLLSLYDYYYSFIQFTTFIR